MREWKVCYTKKYNIGKRLIDCVSILYVYAETIEEAISIAKRELSPDAKIIRCEVWYINERTLQDYTRNL